MGTAIKHPVPDQVKPSFVIFDIRVLWPWASECPDVKNYKWRLNLVWHRMLYSCTHNRTSGRQRVSEWWTFCVDYHQSHIGASGRRVPPPSPLGPPPITRESTDVKSCLMLNAVLLQCDWWPSRHCKADAVSGPGRLLMLSASDAVGPY